MFDDRWSRAKRVLCVRLDNLGDVLMTTPAMRALKQSYGEGHLTLLTSPAGAAAAAFIAEIDETIVYDAPWMKGSSVDSANDSAALIALLRAKDFDAAVVFTVYSQSPLPAALVCHMAGIPLRLAHCRENPYQLLTDWVRESEPEKDLRHEVQRQLDLVATVGAGTREQRLSFKVPQACRAWADQWLRQAGIAPGQAWIVLHPGASAPSRRYPVELWARVVEGIAAQLACPVILTGSGEEQALVEAIRRASAATATSLAGLLELGQLGALIERAPVLLCGNSGPAHIAAALGTSVVDLYALTNPQHTPWQTRSRVLFNDVPCRFCYRSVCPQQHHRCLREIAPGRVVAAVGEMLSGTATLAETGNVMKPLDPSPWRLADVHAGH